MLRVKNNYHFPPPKLLTTKDFHFKARHSAVLASRKFTQHRGKVLKNRFFSALRNPIFQDLTLICASYHLKQECGAIRFADHTCGGETAPFVNIKISSLAPIFWSYFWTNPCVASERCLSDSCNKSGILRLVYDMLFLRNSVMLSFRPKVETF